MLLPVSSREPDVSGGATMTPKEHMQNTDQPQPILFATHQTIGILDLGASQTVMGRYQVDEFLSLLPDSIRSFVYEQAVDMSFRFGNNTVVPCRVALMVPVDRFWIKIAIVETKTPFLISNNVCRSLGAVIDTTNQSIWLIFPNLLRSDLPDWTLGAKHSGATMRTFVPVQKNPRVPMPETVKILLRLVLQIMTQCSHP